MVYHTDGPWKIKRKRKSSNAVHISGKGWGKFARIFVRLSGDELDDEQGIANANLICAAPEMFDILRKFSSHRSKEQLKELEKESNKILEKIREKTYTNDEDQLFGTY